MKTKSLDDKSLEVLTKGIEGVSNYTFQNYVWLKNYFRTNLVLNLSPRPIPDNNIIRKVAIKRFELSSISLKTLHGVLTSVHGFFDGS